MFRSIRWKFITVYFLLVLIAMLIVTTFIVKKLETYQIDQISSTMENSVRKFINSSTDISQSEDLNSVKGDIQKVVREWPISSSEMMYVINAMDEYRVVADTTSSKAIDRSAFDVKQIREDIVLWCQKYGEPQSSMNEDYGSGGKSMHIAYPVLSETGEVKGIVYMVKDLNDIYKTLEESKNLLFKATAMALGITVVLGFFIARSITEPINDLTIKAEKMAEGDFNQVVEVKSDDEIGQLASMFNNLTSELKKTISKLTREKNKLDIIFANMADGVILVDKNENIIHANGVVSNIIKTPYYKLLNSKYDSIFESLNKEVTLKYIKEKGYGEGQENVEIDSNIYNVRYALIEDEKKEIDGMIVVFRDVTEQQKLDNMRKEFVADVSHELKTPITTIKSYAETLMENDVDKETSIQFLSVIDEECDRMARIVRDLLQLSNFDYKQVDWNKVDININKFMEKIYLKVKMSSEEKKQLIEMNIPENISNIFADKDAIEQVLLNIITNAIKYTPEKGKIEISASEKNENIIISVKDNGIGIPKEDLNRIFERFYRVDKARARELGGTGLGLSIAKQIIETHGGKILIQSEYNHGTRVDIIFPFK
ncbi:sensor signal transduction histidine kinase [Gottschalkia acidurici 9a]|uniref:histidine kinase n=1 Tax=Gottschalkia acidurici (strain ATCC 7906 / DSM 604 / BCRC 14475 / CIP 104303 / KCTC 5404 / NCIMB 10678 / 9a) TaxID=1128398 RepID=K0B5N6_GOTA9|nr:ATP-binding protein [Gottschalkia acidurici]AFS79826.1 sensor signal transduction histidine kinase [Gottschalkia acidurici 9a]